MKKIDAFVIGDVNIDLVVAGCSQVPEPGQEVFVDNITMHVGGGAALFAISLAKLGFQVAFNGVLGEDIYGRYVREQFSQYGIDTRWIKTSQKNQTGITIAINPERDRSFITYAGSNSELSLDLLNVDDAASGRHVHLTGYRGKANHDAYVAAAKALKERGVTLSCDVGWDDTGEWYKGIFELMSYADVFFMNETEAIHYTGCETIEASLAYLAERGDQVVVRLGADGAVAIQNGKQIHQPVFKVDVVDTTGAGDSFNAGFLYGFLTKQSIEACLRYGNACGALSVSAYGGSTGTPNLEGLHGFLQRFDDSSDSDLQTVTQE